MVNATAVNFVTSFAPVKVALMLNMKVLIIDDHPLFLVGLRHIFADVAANIALLEATSFAAAFSLLEKHADIDWICLDLQLPSGNGFEFLHELRQRRFNLPVAILSADEAPASVDRALDCGVIGYLSKSSSKAELVAGLSAIARGETTVSPSLQSALAEYRAQLANEGNKVIKLTRRQREILSLVAAGDSNQLIAEKLHLAESTVKGHVSSLYELLGVANRAACTNRALKLNLLD